MGLVGFFYWFKKHPKTRLFVLAISIIGTMFGFSYYEYQLSVSPLYLWPFIPDSPFFTLMYVIILILYIFGRRYNSLDIFAFIGLNKVGIWTLFVLLLYYDYYFSPETLGLRALIFFLHIGMILVAFTLIAEMEKPGKASLAAIISYFFISDFFDYVIGTHPTIPEDRITLIAFATLFLTLFISLLTITYLQRNKKDNKAWNQKLKL